MEDALEECAVARAPTLLLDLVDAPGRPGVHWWVHIGQGPLVRGQLSIGVHVPLAQEQGELFLGEIGVYQGQGNAVEGQVPGSVPGVLPLVRHGDDIGIVQMRPLVVAPA